MPILSTQQINLILKLFAMTNRCIFSVYLSQCYDAICKIIINRRNKTRHDNIWWFNNWISRRIKWMQTNIFTDDIPLHPQPSLPLSCPFLSFSPLHPPAPGSIFFKVWCILDNKHKQISGINNIFCMCFLSSQSKIFAKQAIWGEKIVFSILSYFYDRRYITMDQLTPEQLCGHHRAYVICDICTFC